ncbi:SWIM zinc finger family protein [Virgisporangium aurantiacum]|uniref:SWIM-type domain-containing protein n=1 Tax=Virgisporangium aurantiacum TaxID=175570 RepID=A0A8J3Z9I6_9ACTN|nr:SWIM zinc finger family protein [Virgisporangium aurantiacum]GIJ57735.1 hypothetical protein Vau01_052510 [Virgisporangium aurantiacum]
MVATRFGLTWWGQRWIAALETLGRAYANRLPRGRTYARNGSVTDLTVAPGVVTARVHGSRRTPYRVSLRIPAFTDPQWTAATHALARQLRHAAALLDGRMPEDVDETLDAVGLSLFPTARDLTTTCSCPDEANPCKHVAAVHYTLAHTFDADPFLLPALRGRDRTALLAAIRAARTGTATGPDEPTDNSAGVPISTLSAATLFSAAGDLTTIALRPDHTTDPHTTLRRLGPPPGFDSLDLLADAVERAAGRARVLLHDDTDDPVLSVLRQIGPATTADLATALDQPAPDIRAALRTLVAAGLVSRTGHARTTKYHA